MHFKDRGGGGGIRKRLGPRPGGAGGGGANLRNIVLDEGDAAMGGDYKGASSSSGYQAGRASPSKRGYMPWGGGRGGWGGRGGYVNASEFVKRAGGTAGQARSWHKVQVRKKVAMGFSHVI